MSDYSDIGRELPGARKHLFTAAQKKAQPPEVTKRTLWPEPDWKKLLEQGVSRDVLAYMSQYYAAIRGKPRRQFEPHVTSEMWQNAYFHCIQILRGAMENVSTMEQLTLLQNDFPTLIGFPNGKEGLEYDEYYPLYALGTGENRSLRGPFSLTRRQSSLARLLPKIGWPEEVRANNVSHFPQELVRRDTGEIVWQLCCIRGKKLTLKHGEKEFATEADAIDELRDRLNISSDTVTPKKKLDGLMTIELRKNNIDPDLLQSNFGFDGVQYGRSLSLKERAKFVDNTYRSLKLLSHILGIPDRAVGLKGIGIAFGARGISAAAAHYERDLDAINLTRHNGPGSIAHEWFHALDAYLATACDAPGYLLSELQMDTQRLTPKLGIVVSAFQDLRNVICDRNTSYYERSRSITSQHRAHSYWTKPSELMARAFESYIQDKSNNIENRLTDWLAYGTTVDQCVTNDLRFHPYPMGDERLKFNHAFHDILPRVFLKKR